jgi:SNF2 family DNA or RNA helicase
VASVTSRYTKDECLDLPPKVYSSRTVRLEGEQARVYKELKKDAVARLKGLKKEGTLSVRNILTESLRLLQVVGGFVPDDDGTMHEFKTKAKNSLLSDVVDEIGQRRCVVWCVFREEVEWLRKRLGSKDGDVLTLTGDTPAAERAENVRRFQRGDAQYFVGTAAAGGTGITLHAADTEIFYSRDYNLVNFLQASDRCHRIGQQNTVSIIKFIAANTVDVKIDETLDRKQDLMTMLLQRPEDYL